MGDSTLNHCEPLPNNPSVYRIWQKVRAEGGTKGEMEDRYRELLRIHGHLGEEAMRWR